jgi:hypothetical protein
VSAPAAVSGGLGRPDSLADEYDDPVFRRDLKKRPRAPITHAVPRKIMRPEGEPTGSS